MALGWEWGEGRLEVALVASTLHWSLRKKPRTWYLQSSCRKRPGPKVTATFATSLMSGNITLPGFATADNLLGAHSSEMAGKGLAELPARKSGSAPSDTHACTPLGDGAQAGSSGSEN